MYFPASAHVTYGRLQSCRDALVWNREPKLVTPMLVLSFCTKTLLALLQVFLPGITFNTFEDAAKAGICLVFTCQEISSYLCIQGCPPGQSCESLSWKSPVSWITISLLVCSCIYQVMGFFFNAAFTLFVFLIMLAMFLVLMSNAYAHIMDQDMRTVSGSSGSVFADDLLLLLLDPYRKRNGR